MKYTLFHLDKLHEQYVKQASEFGYDLPFGCQIGVRKVIVGGEFGKSEGNSSFALKNPPSYKVSGGPTINISQQKMFSSSPKPTETPSGGFRANSLQTH